MTIPDALLDRFFDALVAEIRESRPAYLQSSFTVAEIYQNLVPYRTHRDLIGAEINGDYEDALLRLLAGEGEFLELESEAARKRIQDELRSSNPNTTIYREFAAAEVRLHRGRARMLAADGEGGSPVPRGGSERVEVTWSQEEAKPLPDSGTSDPAVNPDLGLFVSDLFGGTGGEATEEGEGGTSEAPESVAGGAAVAGEAPEAPPVEGVEEAEAASPPPAVPPAPPTPVAPMSDAAEVPSSPSVPVVQAPPTPAGALAPPSSPGTVPLPGPAREVRDAPPAREAGGGLAQVEDENRRLRRIVADQALEILRLKDLLDRS